MSLSLSLMLLFYIVFVITQTHCLSSSPWCYAFASLYVEAQTHTHSVQHPKMNKHASFPITDMSRWTGLRQSVQYIFDSGLKNNSGEEQVSVARKSFGVSDITASGTARHICIFIIFQPLLGAVLVHSLRCNTRLHTDDCLWMTVLSSQQSTPWQRPGQTAGTSPSRSRPRPWGPCWVASPCWRVQSEKPPPVEGGRAPGHLRCAHALATPRLSLPVDEMCCSPPPV